MSIQHADPLDTIRAYAPAEQRWSDARVDAALDFVWHDATPQPPMSFRSRHRRLVAAGAAAGVVFAGAGVAAAVGVLPTHVEQGWKYLYSDPHRGPGSYPLADPATAEKVFAIPGPHGTTFEAWTATNSHHGFCTEIFYAAGSGDTPSASDAVGGAGCQHENATHGLFVQGAGGSEGEDAADAVEFAYEAGAAVRAELVVSTGASYPVTVSDGWLGGWYTRSQVPDDATATVIAYGADGAVLGRLEVQTPPQ